MQCPWYNKSTHTGLQTNRWGKEGIHNKVTLELRESKQFMV